MQEHIYGLLICHTYMYPTRKKKPVRRVEYYGGGSQQVHVLRIYIARTRELLLKIMAVLAKVGTLRERLPSILVYPCLYYCCTAHQALAALRSLCTEGCARTIRSTCVAVCNVIHGPQLLYSSCKFGQIFLMRTVHVMIPLLQIIITCIYGPRYVGLRIYMYVHTLYIYGYVYDNSEHVLEKRYLVYLAQHCLVQL